MNYALGRGVLRARLEVWVVYDRLWRSGYRLGSPFDAEKAGSHAPFGQLWDNAGLGYNS